MKTYIVFLGLFVIGVFGVSYQGDLGAFVHEELVLKEAAEECAAGASLFLDEDEYAEGKVVFDYDEGRKYAEEYLEYIKRNSKALTDGTWRLTMDFEDDRQGYGEWNTDKIPAVLVKIQVRTAEDMFKVPFIQVRSLERSTRYELPAEEHRE